MPGINVYEFFILLGLALVLLGPERLPQYAQALARWVRKARVWADDAKVRFKEETGTDFDEVDWQKYDPRQYDPRRIIREALADEYNEVRSTAKDVQQSVDPRELFAGTGAKKSGALAAGVAGSAATTAASSEDGSAEGKAETSGAEAAELDVDPLENNPTPYDTEAT